MSTTPNDKSRQLDMQSGDRDVFSPELKAKLIAAITKQPDGQGPIKIHETDLTEAPHHGVGNHSHHHHNHTPKHGK